MTIQPLTPVDDVTDPESVRMHVPLPASVTTDADQPTLVTPSVEIAILDDDILPADAELVEDSSEEAPVEEDLSVPPHVPPLVTPKPIAPGLRIGLQPGMRPGM